MYKICEKCGEIFTASNDKTNCVDCNGKLSTVDSKIPMKEIFLLTDISRDVNFIKTMSKLYDEDPIEYQLKMSQFKLKLEDNNKPKCPKCNSTSITTGARGVNFTFGLLGASKTVNRCASCGHTWKP